MQKHLKNRPSPLYYSLMISRVPRFRLPLSLGFLLVFCGCSARKTMIDMRTMPVWTPTDTATSCIIEVASHHASHPKVSDEDGIDRNLVQEILSSHQSDHLPSRFFGFHERIRVDLRLDACRNSPDLNGLSVRLQEILHDSQGRQLDQDALSCDSLLFPFDTTSLPSDLRTDASTSLRILQVGQEDLPSWGRRLGQELRAAKESRTWQGTTMHRDFWLLSHAWLPNRPRTLVMQSTTRWGSKTIVDTFTIDTGDKRLLPGFQP